MAKVKIQGHASGSGVFTITAPNSNTDRTITLPDASVTLGTDATKLPLAGGAMTGAITTNSTFDGVDVAAASVLASAALPKGGGTMSGEIVLNSTNLTCGDSTSNANKIRMGASDDLNIHHDGSNSYIEDSGTGALRILGSSIELRNAPSDNELMLKATVDGSVELYHNNVKKLETTATGITVTGQITQTTAKSKQFTGQYDGREVNTITLGSLGFKPQSLFCIFNVGTTHRASWGMAARDGGQQVLLDYQTQADGYESSTSYFARLANGSASFSNLNISSWSTDSVVIQKVINNGGTSSACVYKIIVTG